MNALLASSWGTPTEAAPSGSSRCRFLYITGQLGCGGAERQLSCLLHAIDRERYPSQVLVWNYDPDDSYVNEIRSLVVPIHSFPQGTSRVAKLQGVRRLAQSLQAEVIHSWNFFTNFAAYWAALKTNAVALGSVREEFAEAKKGSGPILGRLSARWPRYQISNNVLAAEEMRSASGPWSPLHIRVVRNGIDLQRFAYSNCSDCGKPSIVGVGSLLPLKRWDRILRVVRQVRSQGIDCTLTIAGEGPERASLERMVRDLGLGGHVQLIGATSDVPELLRESRLLVHASETEGCPNAVMEAMACGRAVLATDSGDVPLLVDDGKTGFVVSRGNEKALAERLVELVTNPDLCMAMGRNGRKKAEREFDTHSLVTGTLDAYRAAGWRDE